MMRLTSVRCCGVLRSSAAIGLVIAMLASVSSESASGQQAGQEDDTTYVFALDGMVIDWRGDWELDLETGGQEVGVDIEVIGLVSPFAQLLIGEIQSDIPFDLNQFLDGWLDTAAEEADEFVTVERSETDTVSYSLDAAVIQGVPAGLFTYVQPNTVTGTIIFTSIIAEATAFARAIADAQANVTVNGSVALEGIDGIALQNLLPSVVASPDDNDQPDDDDSDQGALADHAAPSFENDDGPSPDLDEEEDPSGPESNDQEEDESSGDLADLGLVDGGLYESPQFGIEVVWSNDWSPNPELLVSDQDAQVDNLGLNNEGGALILVTMFEAGDATPEDFAALWESDEFLEENASEGAEVLRSDSTEDESAVLIADTLESGGDLWTLRQAYSLDGGDTIAIVMMLSLAEEFPDNLEAAQDGIEIEGDPVLSLFSVDDIEDAA